MCKKLLAVLISSICFSISAWAEVPVVKATISQPGFPDNGGRASSSFMGCVDDAGNWRAQADDHLGPLDDQSYLPSALTDDNFETAWAVKDGIGSTFSLSHPTDRDFEISSFVIANGYTKNPQRWKQNSRIKELEVYSGSRHVMTLNLLDTPSVQLCKFAKFTYPKRSKLTFKVKSIYYGDTFSDLCVSEFQVVTVR